jgi:hypothetical protein
VRLALLLDDLAVGVRGGHGEAFGQQEIAGVPGATFTTWPRLPSFSTSSLSMTSMRVSSCLELRRERQQGDVARLLDGVGEPPLVRRAHARNAARDDLAALRHEGVQRLDVLVIDVVDLLDAETAYLLAPEILFLPVATALSPPVGRCPALPGLPLNSGMA